MAERSLVYLNHAASAWPRAEGLSGVVASWIEAGPGTVGRGVEGEEAGMNAGRMIGRLRRGLAGLFGVSDPDRVVLTSGGTDAANVGVHAVLGRLGVGEALLALGEVGGLGVDHFDVFVVLGLPALERAEAGLEV
ncbi:MAG: hypothetical protein AAF750_18385, partial [Planctomycetota bacterium]